MFNHATAKNILRIEPAFQMFELFCSLHTKELLHVDLFRREEARKSPVQRKPTFFNVSAQPFRPVSGICNSSRTDFCTGMCSAMEP